MSTCDGSGRLTFRTCNGSGVSVGRLVCPSCMGKRLKRPGCPACEKGEAKANAKASDQQRLF